MGYLTKIAHGRLRCLIGKKRVNGENRETSASALLPPRWETGTWQLHGSPGVPNHEPYTGVSASRGTACNTHAAGRAQREPPFACGAPAWHRQLGIGGHHRRTRSLKPPASYVRTHTYKFQLSFPSNSSGTSRSRDFRMWICPETLRDAANLRQVTGGRRTFGVSALRQSHGFVDGYEETQITRS